MIIRDTFLRDMAKLVAWYPLRWSVMLSPWRLAYFYGQLVGFADATISGGRRRQIVRNVTAVYGGRRSDTEIEAIARRNIQRHYIEHMEFYKYAQLTPENLGRHIRFQGREHLDEALRRGKGAILVHMHYGCKQFPLVALGLLGYDVGQVGYRDKTAVDYSWVHRNVHLRIRMRMEDKFRVKHVHVDKSLRPAYDTLARNGVLMITGDGIGGIRGAGDTYIPIPFLGTRMMFPPGPARLARKTGAAILPLFCIQQSDYTHLAVIEKPIDQQLSADRDADVLHNTMLFTRAFETYINQHPDHWFFWEEFQEGVLIPKPAP